MIHSKLGATAIAAALLGFVACSDDAHVPQTAPARDGAVAKTPPPASVGNTAPTVESVTITPSEPSASDTLQAQVSVRDADGDRAHVEYTWWVNGKRAGEGSSFDLSATRRGARIEVSVTADDGKDQSEPTTASVTLGNSPPHIEGIRFEPSGGWFAGQNTAALPDAMDPDGDPMTFEYTWYHNGHSVSDSGPTFDGSKLSRGDRVQLVVIASDGQDQSNELRTDEIEVSNSSPEITSTPGAIGPDGYFRYQLRANDPDGDRAFMYRKLQGPAGMDVDVLAGMVVWRPVESNSGAHTVEIEVDDRMGGKATQSFTLNVTFGDDANAPASID